MESFYKYYTIAFCVMICGVGWFIKQHITESTVEVYQQQKACLALVGSYAPTCVCVESACIFYDQRSLNYLERIASAVCPYDEETCVKLMQATYDKVEKQVRYLKLLTIVASCAWVLFGFLIVRLENYSSNASFRNGFFLIVSAALSGGLSRNEVPDLIIGLWLLGIIPYTMNHRGDVPSVGFVTEEIDADLAIYVNGKSNGSEAELVLLDITDRGDRDKARVLVVRMTAMVVAQFKHIAFGRMPGDALISSLKAEYRSIIQDYAVNPRHKFWMAIFQRAIFIYLNDDKSNEMLHDTYEASCSNYFFWCWSKTGLAMRYSRAAFWAKKFA